VPVVICAEAVDALNIHSTARHTAMSTRRLDLSIIAPPPLKRVHTNADFKCPM